MDINTPFTCLQGRTAVVTGAARGIGLQIATVLQSVGMTLVLVDRDADELARARTMMSAHGPAIALAANLSTDDSSPAIARRACTATVPGRVGEQRGARQPPGR